MKIKSIITFILLLFAAGTLYTSCKSSANNITPADDKVSGEEIADLSLAPMVPKPITRTHATKVIVN